jgi:hypothetical protein
MNENVIHLVFHRYMFLLGGWTILITYDKVTVGALKNVRSDMCANDNSYWNTFNWEHDLDLMHLYVMHIASDIMCHWNDSFGGHRETNSRILAKHSRDARLGILSREILT